MKLMIKYTSSALETLILFFTLEFLNPYLAYLAYLALNCVREAFIDKHCASQVGCHSYKSKVNLWFVRSINYHWDFIGFNIHNQ